MPRSRDSRGRFVSNNGNGDRITNEQFRQLMVNAVMSRSQLRDQLLDPRRDIDDECGYPKDPVARDFKRLYEREPVAARVVEVLPAESWMTTPTVTESDDVDENTEFEQAWEALSTKLHSSDGLPSHYKSQVGNPVWEHLRRADEISGIGSYGVILLGLSDGKELLEPAETSDGLELLFIREFDQQLALITAWEEDRNDPRFGRPTQYEITLEDPRNSENVTGAGVQNTVKVHWTRVIHLADNLTSSELFGEPRMRPVYNRLYDLRKLYGGSAEMYWRGAFPGLAFETHPQLGGDVSIDASDMRNQIEQYMNGLQRYLAPTGMHVNSLSPQVVDPTPQINTQIEAICIRLGIPKRIFVGSERGELASSQDDSTWNDRLRDRQNGYITPRIIVPFIDRLINLGVLPAPAEENGYSVDWPDLEMLTEREGAEVAAKRTEAMAKYVGGNVEALMVPMDYLTRELGFTNDEAEEILAAAEEAAEEAEAERQEEMEEFADGLPEPGLPGQPPVQPPNAGAAQVPPTNQERTEA